MEGILHERHGRGEHLGSGDGLQPRAVRHPGQQEGHRVVREGRGPRRSLRGCDRSFEQVHIDGNPYVKYMLPNIKNEVTLLVDKLANIYNLDGRTDISIVLIENSDRVRNVNIKTALGDKITKSISINSLIEKYIHENNDTAIAEYGVNYDGETFVMNDGKIQKRPYSLLGVRIDVDKLMKFDERI